MTRSLLSVTVFVLLLSSSAFVPALDAAPVDSTPAALNNADAEPAIAAANSDQALADAQKEDSNPAN